MNCLIEEDSQGLLVDFLPPGYPDVFTYTANVNVAYLAAPWASPMLTGPLDFAVAGGAPQAIDGLRAHGVHHRMYEAATFTTVELPLLGNELAVFFVVPNDTFTGTLDEFSGSLTAEMLIDAQAAAESRYIEFKMPLVDIPSSTIDYLGPLGIDCDPVGGIRQIFHGAAVEMDEKGIKAAAATVVFGDGDSAPEPPEEFFHIDRPFLFFVHDSETGFALFSGRYQGPDL
jgi:serpin B